MPAAVSGVRRLGVSCLLTRFVVYRGHSSQQSDSLFDSRRSRNRSRRSLQPRSDPRVAAVVAREPGDSVNCFFLLARVVGTNVWQGLPRSCGLDAHSAYPTHGDGMD